MLKKLTIARKLALAFGILISVFLVVSAVSVNSFSKLYEADDWNSHTYNVLDHSAALMASMIDQETGIRGFLVSGDKNFLEPYHAGRATFYEKLTQLLKLTSDNAEQQQRLKKSVWQRKHGWTRSQSRK